MVFIFTDRKTKVKYVLMESSKKKDWFFFVRKSKLAENKKKGHLIANLPPGRTVGITKKGRPHLN